MTLSARADGNFHQLRVVGQYSPGRSREERVEGCRETKRFAHRAGVADDAAPRKRLLETILPTFTSISQGNFRLLQTTVDF